MLFAFAIAAVFFAFALALVAGMFAIHRARIPLTSRIIAQVCLGGLLIVFSLLGLLFTQCGRALQPSVPATPRSNPARVLAPANTHQA